MDQNNQVNPAKLFVGNLSYTVTTDQLREKFSQFGTVVDAIVLTDKFSGRSKGFGFVTMSTAEEAEAAVQGLNEQEFDGRKMLVNVARPRAPREFGGGSRGGNTGGGFGRGPRRDFNRDSNRGGRDY
jgi:cold-inducible RNA-binding protein